MRKLLMVLTLLMLSVLGLSLAAAVSLETPLKITAVEVDGQDVPKIFTQKDIDNAVSIADLEGVAVEEGADIEIEVSLEATATVKDIEVEAEIRGFEFRKEIKDTSDRTDIFDMEVKAPGKTTKKKTLQVTFPRELEKDRYLLRLTVDDKDSAALIRYVVLQIEPPRHNIAIADVSFSPGMTIKAGRSLLATVLLENFGEKDEKDVKVMVSIPDLGVKAIEVVDEVETDDHNFDFEDVPEMFLPIPATAKAGEYDVEVKVDYHDLRKTVTKTFTIEVTPNELFAPVNEDKLVLAYEPQSQSLALGTSGRYGIALTNAGRQSKAYALEVITGGWATAKVSENLVVLEPGKNAVVYVELMPTAQAAPGDHLASVLIKSAAGETLQTIPLKATMAAPASPRTGLRDALEIALIVLVVLLVIIGLIIGFARLRRDEPEEEKTYY